MVQGLKKLSLYLFLGLLAYMPLHIFLSTWLGTSFGVLSFAKGLKDVLAVVGFIAALVVSVRQPWFKVLLKDKLIWLIMVYGVLTVGLALLKPTDTDAEIIGVVYNLRYLLFALYGVLLTRLFDVEVIKKRALQSVFASALVVLIFGVVQYTILPNNALAHVGYTRANGVLPVFLIDEKPDLERIMSTVRDPNSLGSYLIIIGMLALALGLRKKVSKELSMGFLLLSITCLIFTFSRSAWLGFGLAVAVLIALQYHRVVWYPQLRKWLGMVAVLVVLAGLSIYPLRNTYFFQNVIFHADSSTVLEDPNQLRVRFWRESLENIKDHPFGEGPGTAGLASVKNDIQGTDINENYYLQIATEVGVAGLALFMGILIWAGWRLLRASSTNALALGLLASFAGLTLTNFLVHIWSNEAVAYTWWGLAGLVLLAKPNARTKTK